jgi:hypothetical protein
MSDPGLFIVGVLVTLLVAAALSLLIYAAILDGRRQAAERRAAGSTPAGAAGERPSDSRASRGAGGLARSRPSGVGSP